MHHLLWNNVNHILRCEFNMTYAKYWFYILVSFLKSSLIIIYLTRWNKWSNQFRECLIFYFSAYQYLVKYFSFLSTIALNLFRTEMWINEKINGKNIFRNMYELPENCRGTNLIYRSQKRLTFFIAPNEISAFQLRIELRARFGRES